MIKPDWPNCYTCGKALTKKERTNFSYRIENARGLCLDCFHAYYSDGYRIDPFGNLKCAYCKKYFPEDDFYNDLSRSDGKRAGCKSCSNERRKKWVQKNHKKKARWDSEYRKHYPEKIRTMQRKKMKRHRESVTVCYAKHLLTRHSGLKWSEITPELATMKMQSIKILREIKKNRKERKKWL